MWEMWESFFSCEKNSSHREKISSLSHREKNSSQGEKNSSQGEKNSSHPVRRSHVRRILLTVRRILLLIRFRLRDSVRGKFQERLLASLSTRGSTISGTVLDRNHQDPAYEQAGQCLSTIYLGRVLPPTELFRVLPPTEQFRVLHARRWVRVLQEQGGIVPVRFQFSEFSQIFHGVSAKFGLYWLLLATEYLVNNANSYSIMVNKCW